MVLFVLASAACGLALDLNTLVVARFVQGLGAALVTPTALALIREAYTDAGQRARAIAYWAMGGSIAAAAGPIVGRALTQVDWRIIFFLNLPVGALALLVLSRVGTSPRHAAPFDWIGQLTAVLGLAALTYGIIEGSEGGYSRQQILTAFAVAVLALVVFLLAQSRGRHPMVPLDLFRSRRVVVALAAAFIGMSAFYGLVFVQSLYFQQIRGESALSTGLLFLPMTALVAAVSPIVPRVAARYGLRLPIIGGQIVLVAGLVALACVPASTLTWVVAVLMIPVGVGGSFTVPPLTSLVIDSVPARRAGTASGVLNMFRQMGGSLGVAAVGSVLAVQASFVTGLRIGLLAIAGLVVLTIAASLAVRDADATVD